MGKTGRNHHQEEAQRQKNRAEAKARRLDALEAALRDAAATGAGVDAVLREHFEEPAVAAARRETLEEAVRSWELDRRSSPAS